MVDSDSFKKGLGTRVKQLRESRGNGKFSLADLADSLPSVSRANLGRIENGEVMPSAIFIKEVSSYFEVTADWLLTGEDPEVEHIRDMDLRRLIEAYNLLDINSRQILEANAAFLLSQNHSNVLQEAISKARAPVSLPAVEPEIVYEEKQVYLPILGRAAAGLPIMTEELLEGFIPVPAAKILKNSFVVKVRGDSMIEAGICNGDFVIIHPQPIVENGEITLVKVDGEVTLKKFYRYDFEVRLKPANITMRDIVITDLAKIRILGRMIGLISAEEAKLKIQQEFNEPNE